MVRSDTWLPSIDSKSRARVEQDEQGAILWLTNKSIARTEINPYFMYKHGDSQTATAAGVPKRRQRDLYTFGMRVAHKFNQSWEGRVEGGYQFGNKENEALFGPARATCPPGACSPISSTTSTTPEERRTRRL